MPNLQVLSDVHLEFRKTFNFKQTAPYLALVGDVGQPDDKHFLRFIDEQIGRYDRVFYVPGNHEFYGTSSAARPEGPYKSDVASTKAQLRKIEAESRGKFVLLDCDAYDLDDDYVVLGCTLWSNIVESQRDDVEEALADFHCIEGWSVQANNAQHRRELEWLKGALQDVERREKLAVVLTHHAPTHRGTSDPKYENSPYSSAFATDLDDMLRLPVVAWAFGHTHFHSDTVSNGGCRLVSNQVGYVGEKTGYKPGFYISI